MLFPTPNTPPNGVVTPDMRGLQLSYDTAHGRAMCVRAWCLATSEPQHVDIPTCGHSSRAVVTVCVAGWVWRSGGEIATRAAGWQSSEPTGRPPKRGGLFRNPCLVTWESRHVVMPTCRHLSPAPIASGAVEACIHCDTRRCVAEFWTCRGRSCNGLSGMAHNPSDCI